jgi:ATP-dependent RNA helicase SUPV3L1/SUV3
MFELSRAEDVTGIARGIAFQLVEALGVLERNKIAAEMKDLDQPSRAVLRKYGVRFGAYHIYFPGLLKPAARALAALLWALKQDNVDLAVLSGAQHLASSGRTSFPVDKTVPKDAYRVLGYRQAGERAVRVDILERLADLIRPALAWRESSPGDKPAGAFDGRSFVVTQAMTSLTGSAGEDFASILRALGYRMELRPQPAPKPVAAEAAPAETPAEAVEATADAQAEAASAEIAAEVPAETTVETPLEAAAEVVDQQVTGDPAPSAALLPEVSPLATSEETPVVVEAAPELAAEAEAPVGQAAPEPAAETSGEAAPVTEAAPATEAPSETADAEAAPAAPAEPAMVEVWRPGGRSEERRPRHERGGRHRHQGQGQGQGQRQDGAAADGKPAQDGEKRERPRHHGRRDFRKPQENAPAASASAAPAEAAATAAPSDGAPAREQRGDRRARSEGQGQGQGERKGRDRDRDNKREKFGDRQGGRRDERDRGRDRDKGRDKRDREGGPALRHYASSSNPRERDRAVDPNSPFAKLAALKEQLAGNRKE